MAGRAFAMGRLRVRHRVPIYIYIYCIQIVKKYVRDTLIPTILLLFAFFNKIVGIKVSRTYFLTICVIMFQHTGRIFIRYYAFYILYIYIYIYILLYIILLELLLNR